ncbi:paeninodin family lasso peptide [Alkalihalobacterium chitinilyticum]|uniref:Paeninodin family lasso peptide n=1 Tax=Alkalihalobacterium chitinilyticum TaxID=2980103 RepID=A0ABT5VEC2_9BACI|nr:paeninodin family lasso peptide [Alkalihalobacterium chitinilyticum]MDE5413809.1 paeninodin family lasso peptide [Alkalihalobacterium chitinilyticum]
MKREWKKPELEVLNVSETMASTVYGPYTDEAYVPGESVDPNDPETWDRFTS